MARKNLLRDLLAAPVPDPVVHGPVPGPGPAPGAAGAPALPDRTRPGRGAIGAVGRGIADLKARAVVELDPFLIDAGGVTDRLEHDEDDHARLMASLRAYGQQVPVLVRPHPATAGRYQIVYGRRRVLALRDLGEPVKALVRDLDDLGLVLAQGQENTARRDLSFIEKANFARQMVDAGYERRIVCDALSVDKTALSRMLSVAERVPPAVIAAIGSAPGIGRDRWLGFAGLYAATPLDPESARDIINISTDGRSPDSRFEALEAWLATRKRRGAGAGRRRAPPETVRTGDGRPLADVTRRRGGLTLTFRSAGLGGFEDWLAANLTDLHAHWRAGEQPQAPDTAES